MLEIHQDNHAKLDECLDMLKNFDTKAKKTLWKLYENCRLTWVELDKEMVQCRRRTKLTTKYLNLQQEFQERINTYKQWAIMAALSY